jgi:hypothetical protein
MLICVECKHPLKEIPIFNNAQDKEFPPSLLFCDLAECPRYGLLTVIFKDDEKKPETKNKKNSDKGVQPEPLPAN